jgi:uncharacterized protein YbjT (DUF2867 family)
MILVVGATGLLGGMITKNLLERGEQVRILVRHNSPSVELSKKSMATDPQTLIEAGAQPVYGDLKDITSLKKACEGVDTVLTTAAATLRDFDIEGVDLNGTRNLIEVARATGVKHFIYTSAYGSDVNSPNPVLKIKALCEQFVKDSGLTYTILSPGVFMEIWIGMVVGMPLQAGQPVTLVGKGDHRHSLVAIPDVAGFGAAVVGNPNAVNQTVYIGGPASYNWTEIVQTVSKAVGQTLPVNYVGFDDPVPLLPAGTPDMLKAMETFETYLDMSQTAPLYGVKLTSLDEFAQRFFARQPM